ncbi:sensor histidine kinase [Paenibacillus macquariensis]|uniref:histidine kinase n=1 Tax=Paenibacillus macquariensis TaxID=948756 RepID=A0ABY1JRC5_9BACL|nr:ATP-binding protein [Paenibacillus macquariensis]MEC0092728.1 ATP-binding protein [Paenibacillus macquariensis]OAB36121.1 two-component sensor histidine kinase [Paenibacillus macquariensis subsp. macquariensis]SIQ64862.1 Signal transduction histidine kinase [Paenibacillus macquariensis]
MTILFISIILILSIIIMIQYISSKRRTDDLKYCYNKLISIVENKSSEKLLRVTDDVNLQSLLTAMNLLLDANQELTAQFTRTEMVMRRMLANMSHDLKTPLTVVLGTIEMILHEPNLDKEEQERLLKMLHQKAQEIVKMIHNFFDLAKLESDDQDFVITRVNMNGVCKNSILSFYDVIQSHHLQPTIEISETPIYAYANEEALERILNNLMDNAIRYGADGKVIGIKLRSDEAYVYIDVWDQGKGIHEQHHDLVFERMYTLEDSRNRSFQGSGLGLTITKRLVEQLGGQIHLRSIPFKKTTFTVQLQRATY